ncbi:discoidin domain-containing protein [Actinopolymorpha sp. B9G3]|uniref:discoidin domain-containing protein n=1 Tax=Actinopolymorpha sp. B9G3 TaxID=3158970 RepID=UPI0032D9A5F7
MPRRDRLRHLLMAVVVACAGLAVAMPAAAQDRTTNTEALAAAPATGGTITVDGRAGGRTFNGVGAVSAGASSRLLADYPEPERSQVLDYLFTPAYGAALDILKVEIGGETNSTDGAEPSHQREPGVVDCDRGYEWWLMKQARKRNPAIKLAALEWGAPGWFDGGFWSQDNIDYILSWLDCAASHGLRIDYVGGWNERGYDTDWYVAFDKALAERFPDIEIIAADECCREDLWRVADDMAANPAFDNAVDIAGVHFACGNRDQRRECHSTETARGLDKPLWMSEVSAQAHDVGAAPAARSINRMYVDARLTGYLTWSAVSAWYAHFPIADTGTILAEWPWSGHYQVGSTVWAFAHTTQFTDPGWRYLDTGSGYLDSGASYVSMVSPAADDFTTVVETLDATEPATVEFDVTGGLPTDGVQVWSTDVGTATQADDFVRTKGIQPVDGSFTMTLEPGHVYTLSSTTGQGKGSARPHAGIGEEMPLPYRESFDDDEPGKLAAYFSDLNGSFETAPCAAGRAGMCYQQQTPQQPITWNSAGLMDPTTVVGDPRWWGDYRVRTAFMLDGPGHVELVGRSSGHPATRETKLSGYHLRVASDRTWELTSHDQYGGDQVLATGTVEVEVGTWHTMALHMRGSAISVEVDDKRLATVEDRRQRTGSVGLVVSGWNHAQFDDFAVSATAPRPRFVPKADLEASATTSTGFLGGYTYEAARAVDDRPETWWWAEHEQVAPLPQAITVDLGARYKTHGIVAQPRLQASPIGITTRYRVWLSNDGRTYSPVAEGSWALTNATKTASWPEQSARFVRLEALEAGCRGRAGIGELDVALTPLIGGTDEGEDLSGFTYVPQERMSATASSYQEGFEPSKAIDGSCTTMWHSRFDPPAPQPHTITLDLGGDYPVEAFIYQPRHDVNNNGIITRYRLSTSRDGESFTVVDSGTWSLDLSTKVVRLGTARDARYVRLEAVDGGAGLASAAELEVAYDAARGVRTAQAR